MLACCRRRSHSRDRIDRGLQDRSIDQPTTTTTESKGPRRRFTEGSPAPVTASPVKTEARDKSSEKVLPDSTADAIKKEDDDSKHDEHEDVGAAIEEEAKPEVDEPKKARARSSSTSSSDDEPPKKSDSVQAKRQYRSNARSNSSESDRGQKSRRQRTRSRDRRRSRSRSRSRDKRRRSRLVTVNLVFVSLFFSLNGFFKLRHYLQSWVYQT